MPPFKYLVAWFALKHTTGVGALLRFGIPTAASSCKRSRFTIRRSVAEEVHKTRVPNRWTLHRADRLIRIGVLFGCFAGKINGPGVPGSLIIYQRNPSMSPKRTPMLIHVVFFRNGEKGTGSISLQAYLLWLRCAAGSAELRARKAWHCLRQVHFDSQNQWPNSPDCICLVVGYFGEVRHWEGCDH